MGETEINLAILLNLELFLIGVIYAVYGQVVQTQ